MYGHNNRRVKLGFDDIDGTSAAIRGAEGMRLTYRQRDGGGVALNANASFLRCLPA